MRGGLQVRRQPPQLLTHLCRKALYPEQDTRRACMVAQGQCLGYMVESVWEVGGSKAIRFWI